MATTVDRPMRADARRNREAIVKAARKVLAQHGAHAQMDDIARAAKLGVGTLYRHFPTKEALIQAIALDHFAQVTAIAREAAEIEDPWDSFEQMLWRAAEMAAQDRALAEVIQTTPDSMIEARDQQQELFAIGERVMRRAQKAGVLRRDAEPFDIAIVMCAFSSTVHAGHLPPEAWKRQMRLSLDGFRANGPARRLPSPA